MGQGIQNEISDVPIRNGVENVRAFAPRDDKPLGAQDAKTLRDGGEFFLECSDEFGDAPFALNKQLQ